MKRKRLMRDEMEQKIEGNQTDNNVSNKMGSLARLIVLDSMDCLERWRIFNLIQ